MKAIEIERPSTNEINAGLLQAANSPRSRHAQVLHKPGDEFNRVFNFLIQDTYMQPHLHPGAEKIEKIHLIQGKLVTLFFDDNGNMAEYTVLEAGGTQHIEVPAFTWHTYIMLTEHVVTYETMMGVYEAKTWKQFAAWAPPENTPESAVYLQFLKENVFRKLSM
jgi:cupin fold WbuC family metalloprotein